MVALVDNIDGADVANILGRGSDTDWVLTVGQLFADLSRDAASSYTRGVGFEDADKTPKSLRHVILLRAVRLATNYLQLQRQDIDNSSVIYGMAGQGFTLNEIVALNDYRRTAC